MWRALLYSYTLILNYNGASINIDDVKEYYPFIIKKKENNKKTKIFWKKNAAKYCIIREAKGNANPLKYIIVILYSFNTRASKVSFIV